MNSFCICSSRRLSSIHYMNILKSFSFMHSNINVKKLMMTCVVVCSNLILILIKGTKKKNEHVKKAMKMVRKEISVLKNHPSSHEKRRLH